MARRGDVRTATATTSVALLLGERGNRKAVILFPPASGSYTVSDSATITNGQGIYLTATSDPVKLLVEEVGDLVQQALFVVASGSIVFGYVEVIEERG